MYYIWKYHSKAVFTLWRSCLAFAFVRRRFLGRHETPREPPVTAFIRNAVVIESHETPTSAEVLNCLKLPPRLASFHKSQKNRARNAIDRDVNGVVVAISVQSSVT